MSHVLHTGLLLLLRKFAQYNTLPIATIKTLRSFLVHKLDYCNSIFGYYMCLVDTAIIQNNAARFIVQFQKMIAISLRLKRICCL